MAGDRPHLIYSPAHLHLTSHTSAGSLTGSGVTYCQVPVFDWDPMEFRDTPERDEVCISKTEQLGCRVEGQIQTEFRTRILEGLEGAWLQLVCCALLYTQYPISERESEVNRSPGGRVVGQVLVNIQAEV
jgi:hypothetical protein